MKIKRCAQFGTSALRRRSAQAKLSNRIAVAVAAVSVALVAAVLPTACGGGDALTLYSGRSEALVAPLIEQFSAETGIRVNVRYGGSSLLAATLLEEGANTPADVFWSQEPGTLLAVSPQLRQLPNAIVAGAPSWARADDARWVGTSARVRSVVYNTESVAEADLPDDMFGFVAPEWRGRIGWAPANASFQAMVTEMRAAWGEARTREWLTGISANEPTEYAKNTPIVAAVIAGEVEVGFVNHYYLYRAADEAGGQVSAENYYLSPNSPGATLFVSGVGVSAYSENGAQAEQLVQFLLSDAAQKYFTEEIFELPVVSGVTPRSGLPDIREYAGARVNSQTEDDLRETQDLLRAVGVLP